MYKHSTFNHYILVLLLFLIHSSNIIGQHASNWILGYDESDSLRNVISQVHFEDGNPYVIPISSPLNFEATSASYSDDEGRLLFYTNGCEIADYRHEIITNGEGLNPGLLHDKFCDKYGYPIPNGASILNDPLHKEHYYIIHMGGNLESYRGISYEKLYYTEVTQEGDDFVVTKKNVLIDSGSFAGFAMTKTADNTGWWIVLVDYGVNNYRTFLLKNGEISLEKEQIIGKTFEAIPCRFTGNILFSSNGKKMVHFNVSCGFVIFDFDRCTGKLSNPIWDDTGSSSMEGGSAVFDQETNNLYLSSFGKVPFRLFFRKLYKIDLSQLGNKINPYVWSFMPFNQMYLKMALTENGDIYASNRGGYQGIHSLNLLEEENIFDLDKIRLNTMNIQTMPYFPNYNLDISDVTCETDVLQYQTERFIISLSPNPTNDICYISSKSSFEGNIQIYDSKANFLLEKDIRFLSNDPYPISLSSFPAGVYSIKVSSEVNTVVKKIIKL